ncbi:hypothetical protein R5R35_014437 [Gryllus longicercus]|uniref:Uncharacterized protein n=1 Tax=Gryllus longicercus TaxID=2509291 RepID=A0AAN9YVL0_9ORTH
MDKFIKSENIINSDAELLEQDKDNLLPCNSVTLANFRHEMMKKAKKEETTQKFDEMSETERIILSEEIEKLTRNQKLYLMERTFKKQLKSAKKTVSLPSFQMIDQENKKETDILSSMFPCLDKSETHQFAHNASLTYQANDHSLINNDSNVYMSQEALHKLEKAVDMYKMLHHGTRMTDYNKSDISSSINKSKHMFHGSLNPDSNKLKESEFSATYPPIITPRRDSIRNKYQTITYSYTYNSPNKVSPPCGKTDMQITSLENEKPVLLYTENSNSQEVDSEETLLHFPIKDKELEVARKEKSLAIKSYNEKSRMTNTECKHGSQQVQNVSRNIENSEKLSLMKRDSSLVYTKRITQKCWETWRAYVQCTCSRKAFSDERKIRQAKIQDFIDVLRRQREITDINDRISETGTQKEKYLNPELNRHNQGFKIVASQRHKEILKENEANKAFSASHRLKRNNVTQSTHSNCHTSGFSDANICKCSGLKQTTCICHRYEAQQHIISQQKKQLEVQKKLIDGLKLENLNKDAKLSATQALDNLKSHDLGGFLNDITQTNKIKKGQNSTHQIPILLGQMQQREKWRKMMRERKEQMYKERLLKKELELQNQQRAEEEERKRIENEIKEKRRLRLQAEKRKQLAKEKTEDSMQKAREHYEKKLLQKGFATLKNVVIEEKEKIFLMNEYYKRRILVRHFYEWQHYVTNLAKHKNSLTTSCYNNLLLRKGFTAFLKVHAEKIQNEQVADDFYYLQLVKLAFSKLQMYSYRQQMIRDNLEQQAEKFYHRKLLKSALKAWRLLPSVLEEEREKEKRKEFWRQKVREILPDFSPALEESY